LKVLFADAVYPVAGKAIAALIDKQPLPVQGIGFFAVIDNVRFDQLDCFRPQLQLPVAISFS
jgi:hypothetical protein